MQDDKISAFLDGELDAEDLDEVLARLTTDAGRGELRRLSLARSVFSGCPAGLRGLDVTAAVSLRLEQEAPHAIAPATPSRAGRVLSLPVRRRGWLMPAGGFALAASVALAALLLRVLPESPAPAADVAQAAAVQAVPVAQAEAIPVRQEAPRAAPVTTVARAASAGPNPIPGAMTISSGGPAASAPARELVIAAPSAATARTALAPYLVRHAGTGGAFAINGPLPYARVTAFPEAADDPDQR